MPMPATTPAPVRGDQRVDNAAGPLVETLNWREEPCRKPNGDRSPIVRRDGPGDSQRRLSAVGTVPLAVP